MITDIEMPVGEIGFQKVDQIRVLHVTHDCNLCEQQGQTRLAGQVNVLHGDSDARGAIRG